MSLDQRILQGDDDALYECLPSTDPSCPTSCTDLNSCLDCGCAVVDTQGGPWGDAADVIFCLLPILFLLVVTLKPNPLPTTLSLPLAALFMAAVRLMYLGSDPLLVSASVVSGFHEALTPLSIMAGAILLFDTMESTLCMPFMIREMKLLTRGHGVAELCLLFSFAYMVEGASGFGTPVALGAPMLVSLGYPPLESVVTLLLMNTFATVWGAVGTPIWFGFGNLEGITEDDFLDISYKASIALAVAAFVLLPTMVMTTVCPKHVLWQNKVFLLLALSSCIGPNVALSFVSYEFPSLIGGMVGCVVTAALIQFRIGMVPVVGDDDGEEEDATSNDDQTNSKETLDGEVEDERSTIPSHQDSRSTETNGGVETAVLESSVMPASHDDEEEGTKDGSPPSDYNQEVISENGDEFPNAKDEDSNVPIANPIALEASLGPRKQIGEGYIRELFLRTSPLTGSVLLLIVTRVPAFKLRDVLTDKTPNFSIYFGTYGTFRCSASLVLQLENILTYPNINWKYELLYIPFIMPFAIMSFLTMFIFRKDLQHSPRDIIGGVVQRLKKPAVALMGALVLVQLLINEGPAAPATIIGNVLSDAFKEGWLAVSALIGALGSFFSGSTTVSNLTFGGVQFIAAQDIGTSTTAMLALQAAGASAGNGICLNNIIAACAVVGLDVGEGKIIARTWKTVLLFCILATGTLLAFFFRFD